MAKQKLGPASEIPTGKAKKYSVNGTDIAVFNINGKFYAINHKCTHHGGPLAEGKIDGTTVTCPWHGSTFDVTSGKVLHGPAVKAEPKYKVTKEGSDLFIDV